ncbi:MAG: asparaginase domain-containing protein, partial [Flavobacteriaceae bacterium]|nr:asparaginase domain-containing protein [Flavobacteriaceae bacterium]
LENLEKPVIITGSQLPVGDLRTDAKENLITSIQLASLQEEEQAVIQEVAIYFEYKLYRGNRATKISTDNFEAFYSGNFPPLAESGVRLNVHKERLWRNPSGNPFKIHTTMASTLLFVSLYPGISPASLAHLFDSPGIKLVILETFGAGNAPTDHAFLNLIQEKIKQGIVFINLTQCLVGRVEMGLYETSSSLKSMGVISAADMTRESCITKSMYLLGQEVNSSVFEQMFTTSLRGELS